MKESKYRSYDDLWLVLNVEMVTEVLRVSLAGSYELIHDDGSTHSASASGWSYLGKS